jgi:hypothetical protein
MKCLVILCVGCLVPPLASAQDVRWHDVPAVRFETPGLALP